MRMRMRMNMTTLSTADIEKYKKKLKREQDRADKKAHEEKRIAVLYVKKKKQQKIWINPAKLLARI